MRPISMSCWRPLRGTRLKTRKPRGMGYRGNLPQAGRLAVRRRTSAGKNHSRRPEQLVPIAMWTEFLFEIPVRGSGA